MPFSCSHGQDALDTCNEYADYASRKVFRFIGEKKEQLLFLEPSAGAGSFVRSLEKYKKKWHHVRAFDILPRPSRGMNIQPLDFLKEPLLGMPPSHKVVVVGNPPFGFAANLAIAFFNKAAQYADIIAFIVPRTFRKISVKKRLHTSFHLCMDEDTPPYSFTKGGRKHDVPCAWQIWQRNFRERLMPSSPDISHLLRFTTPDDADFAMRRVGGRAGMILDGLEYSPSSTYFIRSLRKGVKKGLAACDFSYIREQTVGVRSVSKVEIAWAISKIMNG